MLDLLVRNDATLLGVDQEHAPRLQPALAQHAVRRDVQHADLGSHHHQVVLGDVIPRRPQAVAVQHGTDLDAVRECDRGRAIPRFHETGVVLVERPLRIAHALVVLPRLRDHHHHRVRQRTPGEDQQFETVVEHGRVAAVGVDDRQDLPDVLAEQVGFEHRLTGVHPVDVTPQRVDLAIVGYVPIRMRPLPARKRVRAEAGVDQGERALEVRVVQVRIVLRQLVGCEHAFVTKGLVGHAGAVPVMAAFEARVADLGDRALADHVELALERHVVGQIRAAPDEDLAHERFARLRGVADHRVVRRYRAPADHFLPFLGDNHLEEPLAVPTLRRVGRQEQHPDAVLTPRRQLDARVARGLAEKLVRHLDEHPRAVAGIGLRAAGAAMRQVFEHLQALPDDFVRRFALDVDHEADATGVMLEPRVVQTLLRGGAKQRAAGRRGWAFNLRRHRRSVRSVHSASVSKISRLIATSPRQRNRHSRFRRRAWKAIGRTRRPGRGAPVQGRTVPAGKGMPSGIAWSREVRSAVGGARAAGFRGRFGGAIQR